MFNEQEKCIAAIKVRLSSLWIKKLKSLAYLSDFVLCLRTSLLTILATAFRTKPYSRIGITLKTNDSIFYNFSWFKCCL